MRLASIKLFAFINSVTLLLNLLQSNSNSPLFLLIKKLSIENTSLYIVFDSICAST